ncbi:MAG: Tol-Pal system protein TolB [Wolinella sp.]
MRILILLFLGISSLFAVDATLEVVKHFAHTPLIVVEYASSRESERLLSGRVYKMVIGDLKMSAHFNVQEGGSMPFEMAMEFDSYRERKIDLVARVKTVHERAGIVSELRLYDINSGELVLNKSYRATREERYPFAAHKIAIDINSYIKAPSIEWMDRFVVLAKYTAPSVSQIMVADYTLTFQSPIVQDGRLNIFPKWANAQQDSIYYTKYLDKPTLFYHNLYTGESREVLKSSGMLVVSDISNDGKKLLLTMAPQGQADIFLFDLETQATKQLTRYRGIDVSAHFVEDEQRVIFISDRLGYPNVFAVPLDGSEAVEQMVFHGRNNNAASAFGQYIVYSSRESSHEFENNTFNLYLVSTKSDYIRRLTANGINQMPRFSKDGETIMYLKHSGTQSALGIIRLNYNKSYLSPLANGRIQSMDW